MLSRLRHRTLSLVATLSVVYAVFLLFALVAQERFIFPGAWMLDASTRTSDRPGLTVMTRDIGDSGVVEAIFLIRESPGVQLPLVVLFHGNAELIDDYLGEAEALASEGFAVLIPEYRGYGRSAGRPGATQIREDAAHFLDAVLNDPRVDPTRVAFIGRSLGGAIAADLATVRPPKALVLESTFTRLSSMFARAGLPPFVVRHPYDSIHALRNFSGSIMIVHGSEDVVVPTSHGRTLQSLFPAARYFEPDAGHYPSVEWTDYDAELRRFLADAGVVEPRAEQSQAD